MKVPPIEKLDKEHEHEFLDEKLDPYPSFHESALSEIHGGDVCPRCGEALRFDTEVRNHNGERGMVLELAENDVTVPLYHLHCYTERMKEVEGKEQKEISDYIG